MPPASSSGYPRSSSQRRCIGGRHPPQQLTTRRCRKITQGVDRFIRLHGDEEARGLVGIRFAQQLFEIVGLHLLERVGGFVVAQRGQQFLTFVAAEVLQQVGQLAGAQTVQAFMGHLEADLRRPVDGVVRLRERLDRGPVDDAVGCGLRTPAARPQPAEQRGCGDVGPHKADTTEHFGQIEVGGPDDLDPIDVHQLMVEDVLGQEHLTRTADNVT